jgi:polyisoprenoid-binding protein YceI
MLESNLGIHVELASWLVAYSFVTFGGRETVCHQPTHTQNQKQHIKEHHLMKTGIIAAALAILLPLSPLSLAADTPPASTAAVPAGVYKIEKSHATLLFKVNHIGFSNYTARFKKFDAELQFDPNKLAASTLTATVDARSIETDYPFPEQIDFNKQLQNKDWLDTAQFPEMKYVSKKIDVIGDKSGNKMRINGELTLRGVTKPVVLEATYNGGYAGHPMDPHARIGFSAQGVLKRSEFGITYGIPAPGTTMGVGDDVTVILELEFSGPPLKTK